MEHTKTPWAAQEPIDMEGMRHIFIRHNKDLIGRIDGHFRTGSPTAEECTANAEFIVTACNAHDDLLKVCEEAQSSLESCKNSCLEPDKIICITETRIFALKQEIAKAKGE
jgi:hypothetical protein